LKGGIKNAKNNNHWPVKMVNQTRLLRLQYFLYFGTMGAVLPFFNLYCYHIGLSGFEIGVLSAAKSLTIVIFPIFWSLLADHFRIRRPLYIFCNLISLAAWCGYFFTTAFMPMLAITFFYGIFYAPIIAMLETFTMENLSGKIATYGHIRVWGSVSFILVVVVLGKLIDHTGVAIILGVVAAGSFLFAAASLKTPTIPPQPQMPLDWAQLKALLKGPLGRFLSCAFLMLLSHSAYYGFFSIHLEELGFSGAFIGSTWAIASIAEISVMAGSAKLIKHFGTHSLIAFALAVAVIRWLVFYFTTTIAWIIFGQILHAVTYGVFHVAGIVYVDQLSPQGRKTMGQAVNNAVTYGLGLTVGFYLNGWLFSLFGSRFLFGVAAVTAATAGGWFWLFAGQAGLSEKTGTS